MRTLCMLFASLFVFAAAAGPALAQVAAPSLAPIGSFSNPAALAWERASRVAALLGDVEQSIVGAPADPVVEGDLLRLEAQWVGETFAVALDQQTIDLTIDPALGGGTLDIAGTSIFASAKIAESYSVGIGQESEEVTDPAGTSEVDALMIGGTIRIGEIFYLGAMRFDESQSATVGGVTTEADRPVTGFGAAVLWRDGNDGLHLEISQTTGEADAAAGIDEEVSQRIVLEGKLSGVLVSYESETEEDTSAAGVALGKDESTTILVGWVPEQGLAVFGGTSETDTSDGAGNPVGTGKFTVIGAAWTF